MAKNSKDIEIGAPRMVKSHNVTLDAEYVEWIADVKHRFRSAQIKAEASTIRVQIMY